jgi:protein-tyrosine phosphatase
LICTDDEHEVLLTRRQRQRVYDSLKLAVADIAAVKGNICVFCKNGRSRSAAFVSAYIVMACGYTPAGAYDAMSAILVASRPAMCDARGIDRDRRFYKYIECLYNKDVDIS